MINRAKIGGGVVFATLVFVIGVFYADPAVVWTQDSVSEQNITNTVTELGTLVSGVPMNMSCTGCGNALTVKIDGTETNITSTALDSVSFEVPPLTPGEYEVAIDIGTDFVNNTITVFSCDTCRLADDCFR